MANAEGDFYELGLSEYDSAAHDFFSTGVREIMLAQGGVYSLVSREPMEQLPDYSVELPDSDATGGRQMEASSFAAVSLDDVVNGNFDSVLSAMYSMAIEMESQMSNAIMADIAEVARRAGNVVTGELSHDKVIDMIEGLEFTFNDDGSPNLHIIPASPEAREKLLALGEPTADQVARLNEIISRKRDEWNARRRRRSLPPERD
jgi:hypothetical protein